MTQIFTVTTLNDRIAERLEGDGRLRDLWLQGEVSNYLHHRSGHRYFTLKDKASQISCVLFKSSGAALPFEMKEGMNILAFGDVTVYRPQGRVQLIVRGVKEDIGLGFRYLQLEALKKKLAAEGLFAPEKKRPLPAYPERIGIITSPQGAALRDVLKTLGAYPARIILSPAQVQGEGAEESLAQAFTALRGRCDLVILCRGGGSVEDLWCFNSEIVARAIANCDAPVISAVGHETDFTIADFVADVRAATPTAAAKLAAPDVEAIAQTILSCRVRMMRALWTAHERRAERLEYLKRSVSARRMAAIAADARQRLDYLSARQDAALVQRLKESRSRLENISGRLEAVGPAATLQRGYAIARSERGLLLAAGDARPGEVIELILAKGRLTCQVMECRSEQRRAQREGTEET